MIPRDKADAILGTSKRGRGRPAGKPDTVIFHVLSIYKAIDKAGKLDQVSYEGIAKMVKKKFPNSKFDEAHAQWYLGKYKREKAERERIEMMKGRPEPKL